MITPCYPNGTQTPPIMFGNVHEEIVFPSSSTSAMEHNSSNPTTHSSSFLYNLSVLRDKLHQVQSLAAIFISNDHDAAAGQAQHESSTAMAMPTMGTLIQEIIVSASSMMFSCQQMALGSNNTNDPTHRPNALTDANGQLGQTGQNRATLIFGNGQHEDAVEPWFGGESYNNCNSDAGNNDNNNNSSIRSHSGGIATGFGISSGGGGGNKRDPAKGQWSHKTETNEGPPDRYDIIELDASDLLAKYTHYCQVCGKGFKRDANLRMHMRAHGDEYKSSAALSNPMKRAQNNDDESAKLGPNHPPPRKYSCPHEGCRWNKNHAKFQPLKSMICAKNHYKRSHCPKMYVCKRCNRKQFSVLSDLRMHEKHCGDQKWQCSCGTTFSRKDKLMGHVALFVGHTPAIKTGSNNGGQGIVQTTMDIERR